MVIAQVMPRWRCRSCETRPKFERCTRVNMAHLDLNQQTLIECRRLAGQIVAKVKPVIDSNTSVSIERSVLRLIGVEGSIKQMGMDYPVSNFIVDQLREDRVLSRGA